MRTNNDYSPQQPWISRQLESRTALEYSTNNLREDFKLCILLVHNDSKLYFTVHRQEWIHKYMSMIGEFHK